jgi:predicted dehydrogenase
MKRFKSTKDIKVGVIGYGGAFNMGRTHLGEMKKAGMKPVAVAELDEDRLAVAAEEFPGIETYNSVGKMLKNSDVNLVTIITPHNTHAKLATQCLRAGRHVVCEKPLAITTAECDRMIREARKQKVMLSTYHNRHWDGCITRAMREIRKGRIGEVVRIECHMGAFGQPRDWWRSSKSISGGILYDWGVHLLEYSLQIVDAGIVEVAGFAHNGLWAPRTAWKDDTNEDEAAAVVRFDSGAWLTLTITQLDSLPKSADRKHLEITGTKGTYLFDQKSWKTVIQKRGKVDERECENPSNQWKKYYRNVARYLTGQEELVITPEWSRRPIHILDLADRSARRGRTLKAKYE